MGKNHSCLRETHIIGKRTQEKIISPRNLPELREQNIYLLGRSLACKGFRFVRENPAHSQLLVCVAGKGKVLINQQWESCSAGSAYVTPAGLLHAYEAIEDWEVCWIIYHARDAHRHLLMDYQQPALIAVDPAGFSLSMHGLYREMMGNSDRALLRVWAQLVMMEAEKLLRADSLDIRLRYLFQLVDQQLAFPWNAQELAKKIHLSPEHLRRLCHHSFGHSPMKQVTHLRMRHAAALLANDSYKIDDIARRVGYANAFAFATAFKRVMGMPPSAYRLQV